MKMKNGRAPSLPPERKKKSTKKLNAGEKKSRSTGNSQCNDKEKALGWGCGTEAGKGVKPSAHSRRVTEFLDCLSSLDRRGNWGAERGALTSAYMFDGLMHSFICAFNIQAPLCLALSIVGLPQGEGTHVETITCEVLTCNISFVSLSISCGWC